MSLQEVERGFLPAETYQNPPRRGRDGNYEGPAGHRLEANSAIRQTLTQVVGRNQPERQGWHPSYCTRDCNNSCLTITGVPGICLFSMGGVYLRTCSRWPFCNRTLPPDKTLIDWARDDFDILQRLLGFLGPNFSRHSSLLRNRYSQMETVKVPQISG